MLLAPAAAFFQRELDRKASMSISREGHEEARRVSERNEKARRDEVQRVADRNAEAHKKAKKVRERDERRRQEMLKGSER